MVLMLAGGPFRPGIAESRAASPMLSGSTSAFSGAQSPSKSMAVEVLGYSFLLLRARSSVSCGQGLSGQHLQVADHGGLADAGVIPTVRGP
ncbi:hypothetical protein Francci3_4123 [Frankia casuarinae]|uniref:Uncharacterized protein n=1 Tax=Frankia casuarinae (strain DSM 45818 / CECT 9043 / HFP020203 / CcI3) TaxID=106370 RepID=Q2J5H1_FRACC|nr:hypothetical protein Francci3_4123 [Frankia casuarinae]